jgi:ubiquinone/menaquinone biosynthesis C-methylase UbiE
MAAIRGIYRTRVAGDAFLRTISSRWQAKRKYSDEIDYWKRHLEELKSWFIDGSKDWWGLPPPSSEQKLIDPTALWQTNAVLSMHRIRPTYHEELKLAGDFFRGKKVLEVGCGPLTPVLQFSGCVRHGLDPLLNQYIEAGWPIYELDVKVVNAFAEKMPYPNAYFDCVISVNALDHVDNFGKAAAEIQRVVRPGGGIYFEVEYHEPTTTEPLKLSDRDVLTSFNRAHMRKVFERSKRELFSDLAKRFQLISERFSEFGDEERFALWHGENE